MTRLILLSVVAVNVLAFIVYGIDKYKAKKGKWRISEATLLFLAFIGGSVGALVGMRVWRHKTKHKKFTVIVPLLLVLQVALVVYLWADRM